MSHWNAREYEKIHADLRERGQRGEPIWERQQGESLQAYEAFTLYLATRSVSEVAKRLGKHPANVRRWRARWGWDVRAACYLQHTYAETLARVLQWVIRAIPHAIAVIVEGLKDPSARPRERLEYARDILRIARLYPTPESSLLPAQAGESEQHPRDMLQELLADIRDRAQSFYEGQRANGATAESRQTVSNRIPRW